MNAFLKRLSNFKKDIFLINSCLDNFESNRNLIIKELVNKFNFKGVYVTFSKPFNVVMKDLSEAGVNVNNLVFIDAVTDKLSSSSSSNVVFVNNPEALTNLSIEFSNIANFGSFNFVFFDSINSLVVHNGVDVSEKFLNYLINKTRGLSIKGFFVSAKDSKIDGMINNLSLITDVIVSD